MNTNKKLDNKGFSLVELIIVIAIMAILVGVVGTQVIPYIEKSRQAKDLQILSGLCTNMTSAASNCAGVLDATANYTITIAVSNGVMSTCSVSTTSSATSNGANELLDNFVELCGGDTSTKTISQSFESKDAKSGGSSVTCVFTQSNAAGTAGNGVVVTLVGANKISKASSK